VIFVTYGYSTHHENGAHTKYWLLLCFQSDGSKCDTSQRNDQCLVQISCLDLLLSYGSSFRVLIWQVPFVTSSLIACCIKLGCLTDLSTTTLFWRRCQQVPSTVLSHWHIYQTLQTWAPSLTVNSDYFLEHYELTGLYI
jgi:hypothetical protein